MKGVISALAALVGLGIGTSAVGQTLEFTAGDVGGVWYTTAAGLAQLVKDQDPGLELKVVPGGGVSNPAKLQNGVSQIGLVQSIFATAAVKGTEPFNGKPHAELKLIAQGLAKNYIHYVRPKGSTKGLAETLKSKGAAIALPRSGSTDEYSFRFAMKYFGTSYDALRSANGKIVQADYGDIANAFKDNHVDSFFVLLGIPGAMIIDAGLGRAAELSPLPQDLIDHLSKQYGYTKGSIPAGTYPGLQTQAVPTVITSTSLYASAKAPDNAIFKIAKAICEHSRRLPDIHKSMTGFDCRAEGVLGDGSVPLHPGAARYYKAAGIAH